MASEQTTCECLGGSTHATDDPAIRRCDLCGGIVPTDPATGEYVQSAERPSDTTKAQEGQLAFDAGLGLDANPYGFRDGRDEWSKGWMSARASAIQTWVKETNDV